MQPSKRFRWVPELNAAPHDAPRSWGAKFRSRHRSTGEFREFLETIGRWQLDPSACTALQEQALRIIAGERISSEAIILLRALASADQTAPELYRGIATPEAAWAVVHQYPTGSHFDIGLASFSMQRSWAEEFAWMAKQSEGDTEVVFTLRPGSQSIRLDVLAPDDVHWREREWYTGGRFAVLDTRVLAGPKVEIIVEQTGVYDVQAYASPR